MTASSAGKQDDSGSLDPEVGQHLRASMNEAPPASISEVLPPHSESQQWPDGSGKHKHPKERSAAHGRQGHEAAVTAVHRTRRPPMPHSS